MMDFRMKCLLCSRSALVIVRRDSFASHTVDCPRCGRYRLSNQFAKRLNNHPDSTDAWSEERKACYRKLLRHAAAADKTFMFQWQDI
jgi:hypothetical protein